MASSNIHQTIRLGRGVALGSFLLRVASALPAGVGRLRDIGRASSRTGQVVPSPGRSYFASLLAEFRRGTLAAQRYEELRYRSAGQGRMAPDAIPPRIFEEVYAAEEAAEPGQPASARSDSSAKALP